MKLKFNKFYNREFGASEAFQTWTKLSALYHLRQKITLNCIISNCYPEVYLCGWEIDFYSRWMLYIVARTLQETAPGNVRVQWTLLEKREEENIFSSNLLANGKVFHFFFKSLFLFFRMWRKNVKSFAFWSLEKFLMHFSMLKIAD